MRSSLILFLKAHVKGHVRGGKWVSPYETKAPSGKVKAPQYGLFGGHGTPSQPKKPPEGYHPKPDDNRKRVGIQKMSTPTSSEAWRNPSDAVVVTPGHDVPGELNGIPFKPWADHPKTAEEWDDVEGQNPDIDEPDLDVAKNKHPAAGVVIQEADGRIWLVSPTNKFGGYDSTFPKGTVEDDMSLQASAIKEAYEESGLKVEIVDFLMDADRSTSTTRYYLARRVGGSPADMGWESQAVNLVPPEKLYEFLNAKYDHPLAEALGAGPAPKPPAPKNQPDGHSASSHDDEPL